MTAVEWLERRYYFTKGQLIDIDFEKAKEMEKQQERSYSEEEVFFFIREALYDTNIRYDRISVEDWFEQFKNYESKIIFRT